MPTDAPVFCNACGVPPRVPRADVDGIPLVSAGSYEPPLSDAIRRFKFDGRPELAAPLAKLVLVELEELVIEHCVWVPVPLHRARLVERGFNQSALLAAALARATRSRFAARALERCRETEQQARLGRRARHENAVGAFVLRKSFTGRRVVLVDDVVTTGATARACIAEFHAANIAVLAVVALAQATPRSC
jgi:ComF family protein